MTQLYRHSLRKWGSLLQKAVCISVFKNWVYVLHPVHHDASNQRRSWNYRQGWISNLVKDQPVGVKGGEKRSVAFSPGNPAKKMQMNGRENIHMTVENTRVYPVLETSPKPEMAKKRNKKKKQMKVAKETIEEGLSHEGVHFKTFATRHITIILRKMGKPKKRLFVLPSNIFLFCQWGISLLRSWASSETPVLNTKCYGCS